LRKLLVLLAAVAALVVAASPAHAILYGQPDNNEHPYVGVIRFFDEEGNYLHRCTGTLISPTVVLTAGHCTFGTASAEAWFTETAPSTAEVLSGNYTRGITGETYTHPDYDDFATFPNTSDVGIVVLDQRVRLSTYGSLPTVGWPRRSTSTNCSPSSAMACRTCSPSRSPRCSGSRPPPSSSASRAATPRASTCTCRAIQGSRTRVGCVSVIRVARCCSGRPSWR
jgi:hypothetical protein